MRVTEAFSTMFRLAVQNPGWALANLLAVALSMSGLQFAAIYMGLVIVAGVTAGPMFLEAGFQEGTWVWGVFNIAFMIFMALLCTVDGRAARPIEDESRSFLKSGLARTK